MAFHLVIAVILAFFAAGWSTSFATPDDHLSSTDDLVPRGDGFDWEETDGAGLYAQHCAVCHAGTVAKAPHKIWLELLTPQAVLASMTEGVMVAQSAMLSRSEKQAVAEYVTRTRLDAVAAAPEPVACSGEAARFEQDSPPPAIGWGHDTDRFVPAEIGGLTAETVPQLSLKWAFVYPHASRARSQPAVGLGAVFVGSQDGGVYAFDLDSGCLRWHYQAGAEVRTGIVLQSWEGAPPQTPLLFFGDILARTYAVNALTGELVWRVKVHDHSNATLTGTPSLAGDTLLVPVSTQEVISAADPDYPCCTFRGTLVALDINDGRERWRSHSIPQPASEVGRTATGTPILAPSGASMWNSPAVDITRGLVFVGTGQNFSTPADAHSNAIFAFDLKTGEKRWHFQALAGDAWNVGCMMADNPNCPQEKGPDWDFAASPILAPLPDGSDILIAGQKSGQVWGLDPDSGAQRWVTQLGRGGTQGGVHFGMAADANRIYVPISDQVIPDGRGYDPATGQGGVHALDAATGDILWQHVADDVCDAANPYCDPGVSAAITAIPGAVIAGHLDGRLRAYDGANGALLWEDDTTRTVTAVNGAEGHGGSMSGPGPIAYRGHLIVNSGYGLYFHMPGNVLLVYGLTEDAP